MMNKNTIPITVLILLAGLVSCKDDGCNDPIAFNYDSKGTSDKNCIYEPIQVNLNVLNMFGDKAFEADKVFEIQDGRQIKIESFGMYLSQLSFIENGDTLGFRDDVMFVGNANATFQTVYFRKHELDGFRLMFGVDSAVYTGDPTDTSQVSENSPLSLQDPNMWWGWAYGYRYLSLNGMVDTSAAKDGSAMAAFEYHIGLTPNLRQFHFEDAELNTTTNQLSISLQLDLSMLFEGIDFNDELVTHTSDNPILAAKIADNVLNAISIK